MREMKDSGISWVGEIPTNWTIGRIGGLYSLRNQKVSDKDYEPLSVTMKGVLPQLETAAKTNDGDNRKLVRKGDFAINSRSDRRGSCGIADRDGSVSLINTILKPRNQMNARYYNWLFHTPMFADEFYKWGHGIVDDLWSTNWEEMKKIQIPFPPLAEQQRIAEFLDRECGKIDGLKADIQAQIDTLEQYKRSVITEAVTHGLNPSAPMKDSGIPWVGNIPKHWNCCSLKYNYNTISGATPNSNDISLWDGEIVWVTPADYKTKDVYVFSGARKITYKGYLSCSTTLIKQGNIIFSKRAPIGSVAINKVELCTSQGCLSVVRKTENVNNKYFYYLFSVNDETFNLFGSGTTFKEISAKDFLSIKFPLPPLEEQQEIADYLDNKCAEIEQIIADKKTQIETLDGYKKSLIYEYVTGKKEVI